MKTNGARACIPGLVVLNDDPPQFPVGDELANLGAVQDLHAGVPLELVSQIPQRTLPEVTAPDQQVRTRPGNPPCPG